jgi:biotin synthase
MHLTYDEIIKWLKIKEVAELEKLWKLANQIRHDYVGDKVHLRGLIELSNICCRECGYCGLNVSNKNVDRYRMTMEEIFACAEQAQDFGYGTVVLQSGEDFGITQEWMAELIRKIKQQTNLAITLSLGERTTDELKAWKKAGADRYLLRFETSDPVLYKIIHPSLANSSLRHRIAILHELKELGYEVGSGVMIGIPGQSYAILTRDILLFAELDLDMIGVGPFLPHPDTLLGQKKVVAEIAPGEQDQTPNTELMTYKVVALTRIMCPTANIPSTTALATVNKGFGRELGLMRGANVVMPNVTPKQYREKYIIYPNKACLTEEAEAYDRCMHLYRDALDS